MDTDCFLRFSLGGGGVWWGGGGWWVFFFFFFKQKTAYEILTCDWSSDVCSSDLECSKKLGVATSEWRKWMLQLTTFLTYQVFFVCTIHEYHDMITAPSMQCEVVSTILILYPLTLSRFCWVGLRVSPCDLHVIRFVSSYVTIFGTIQESLNY